MSPEFDRPRLAIVPAAPKGYCVPLAMRSPSSRKVIYAAIASNLAIAICKYVAASVTGSAAMWAEAFHSTADSGNELLLLRGIRRSARPPDSLHPFGHGKVLYFYSLLVAVYIFGFGGVLAVRQGLVRFHQPEPFTHIGWNYIVLAVALALDGDLFRYLLEKFASFSGISGVQPKILVRDEKAFVEMEHTGHRLSQSYKGATHIVKMWEANEYPQLAANEYFCLTVARKYGLDVPPTAWPRTAWRWSLTVSICAWTGPIAG